MTFLERVLGLVRRRSVRRRALDSSNAARLARERGSTSGVQRELGRGPGNSTLH